LRESGRSFEQVLPTQLLLPEGWEELAQADFRPLATGLSEASVFLVTASGRPSRYLKIARDKAAAGLREEIARTAWLAHHKVRVPKILQVDDKAAQTTLLTEAVPGFPAHETPLAAADLVAALARAIGLLHALPIARCPFDESIATRLSRASTAIAADEVDPEAFDSRNRGTDPAALLMRLSANRPAEDVVLVHGDATLSNIIVASDGTVGFVDCGNAGRGDRYTDLAVLRADIEDHYGAEAAQRFSRIYSPADWDETKARFFSDLYELF
jgi:aminoglycoside 3'-phosphotransferase-2